MKCDFSETQFSFCYTFEILKKYPKLLKMPWFPNTVQEGREGGGFDVQLDFNDEVEGSLFFQFKIPEYLKKEKKYKITIHTQNKQFNLLKKLRDEGPANLVYYASPKFHEQKQLEDFHNNEKIEENSALFFISDFPTDGEYHNLKYEYYNTSNQPYGILHSDPLNIKISTKIFSNNYQPYDMSPSKKAEYILSLIHKIEPTSLQMDHSLVVKQVFLILLIKYNILWIPIIKKYPV